jgi:hypothetical protein
MDRRWAKLEDRIGKSLDSSFIESVREELKFVPATSFCINSEYKKHTDKKVALEGLEQREIACEVILQLVEVSDHEGESLIKWADTQECACRVQPDRHC